MKFCFDHIISCCIVHRISTQHQHDQIIFRARNIKPRLVHSRQRYSHVLIQFVRLFRNNCLNLTAHRLRNSISHPLSLSHSFFSIFWHKIIFMFYWINVNMVCGPNPIWMIIKFETFWIGFQQIQNLSIRVRCTPVRG